ncbi:hypothetical protein [Mythimna sequax nucleopolyhedrovirus]|nr:hypothetical protein [Mythimna sequax nucleopolyhedrovirus]
MDLRQNVTQAIESLIEQNVVPSNTDLDGLANTVYVLPTIERLISMKRIDLKMILLMEFYKERAENITLASGLDVIERINRVITELPNLEDSALELTKQFVDTLCRRMSDLLSDCYHFSTDTQNWKHCKQEFISMLRRDEVLQMFFNKIYATDKNKMDEDIDLYVANEYIMDCSNTEDANDDNKFLQNWHIDLYRKLRVYADDVIECGC